MSFGATVMSWVELPYKDGFLPVKVVSAHCIFKGVFAELLGVSDKHHLVMSKGACQITELL